MRPQTLQMKGLGPGCLLHPTHGVLLVVFCVLIVGSGRLCPEQDRHFHVGLAFSLLYLLVMSQQLWQKGLWHELHVIGRLRGRLLHFGHTSVVHVGGGVRICVGGWAGRRGKG